MFHRFGLYRVNSLHSFIGQTEIHTGPSLGVFETWVRLSYFGAFVNTQVNVRQSLRKNDTFRLFRKVLSATPLHNFCGLVHISDLMFPVKSVLIPELLAGLPYRFFATSSIDALVHAVESRLSPKATPVSQLFSTSAASMILEGYRYVADRGPAHWIDKAGVFQLASSYAGMAFCSAGCAAVHALSYPLGGGYHIPHGEANQLVFAAVFRKYREKKPTGGLHELEALLRHCLGVPAAEALSSFSTGFNPESPCGSMVFPRANFKGSPKASQPDSSGCWGTATLLFP